MILTSQHCQPFIRTIEGIQLSVPFEKVSELPPKLQTMIGYSVQKVHKIYINIFYFYSFCTLCEMVFWCISLYIFLFMEV